MVTEKKYSKTKTVSAVIVDDHEMFRKGFKYLLNEIPNIKVIGEVTNGIELLNFLETNNQEGIRDFSVTLVRNIREESGKETTLGRLNPHLYYRLKSQRTDAFMITSGESIKPFNITFGPKMNFTSEELFHILPIIDDGKINSPIKYYLDPTMRRKKVKLLD